MRTQRAHHRFAFLQAKDRWCRSSIANIYLAPTGRVKGAATEMLLLLLLLLFLPKTETRAKEESSTD